MIINMERVNQLIRTGESDATLSLGLRVEDIVDERGKFKQIGPRVPLLDAIRGLIARSKHLFPGLVHPAEESGISVDKACWESVIASLERIPPTQDSIDEPRPQRIAKEVEEAEGAHTAALKALKQAAADPKFSMDEFAPLMKASPNRELTEHMLDAAGEGNVGWTLGDRILQPLRIEMPPTLLASKFVEVRGRIYDVDDVSELASLEIDEYRDSYSRSMLPYHSPRIPLQFDKDSAERDDLLVLQYHRHAVWLRASAVCAVSARHARKSALSLSRILVSRAALDQWHLAARQLTLPFDTGDV